VTFSLGLSSFLLILFSIYWLIIIFTYEYIFNENLQNKFNIDPIVLIEFSKTISIVMILIISSTLKATFFRYNMRIIIVIYFIFYIFSYIIKNKLLLEIIIRIVSTLNSIYCVKIAFLSLLKNYTDYCFLLYQGDKYVINMLYFLSAYLLVDAGFSIIHMGDSFNYLTKLIKLQNFFQGLVIYMIADEKIGIQIGLFFALYETSSLLMNFLWVLYICEIENKLNDLLSCLFYLIFFSVRIITIPFICNYLYQNYEANNQILLLLYGEYILSSILNLIQFAILSIQLFENFNFF
jgi:hypothetical protein